MIELYYWPTPNGHNVTLYLEEASLDYTIEPVNISAGDQFKPEFLAFCPNNRTPAIIDHDPIDHGEAVTVFESGAILPYLVEKSGLFLSRDTRGRKIVTEWLFWQMGGLGPMAGQNHHFGVYAPETTDTSTIQIGCTGSSIAVSPPAHSRPVMCTRSPIWQRILGSFAGSGSSRIWTTS
jgi:GST-like protein